MVTTTKSWQERVVDVLVFVFTSITLAFITTIVFTNIWDLSVVPTLGAQYDLSFWRTFGVIFNLIVLMGLVKTTYIFIKTRF